MKWIALALLFVLTLIAHPHVDYGSDGDDAIELGAAALLRGENPYNCRTQLGNHLTPLPGWLILNMPAVVFGAHVWCFLWLALYCRISSTFASIVLLVLASKSIIQGIDYAGNACAVVWIVHTIATNILTHRIAACQEQGVDAALAWCQRSICGVAPERVGSSPVGCAVCQADRDYHADSIGICGLLLLLPPIWASNAAYQVLMAVPFLLYWVDRRIKI